MHTLIKIFAMTQIFKGIQYFFENIAFAPLDAIRKLELSNWWLANTITWVMIAILFVFFFYWLGQLRKFNKEKTERTDATAHSFFN